MIVCNTDHKLYKIRKKKKNYAEFKEEFEDFSLTKQNLLNVI